MLQSTLIEWVQRRGLEVLLAAMAAGGVGGPGGGGGGGGGGGTTSGEDEICNVDVKKDPGSSECKRSGLCGSNECCYTEFVIPPHHDLIPGTMRVINRLPASAYVIHRKCESPYYFLGIAFGRWTCEEQTRTPLGDYFRYELAPCPTPEAPPASGSGD